ncbi:unnamed protein product [Clonostachys byssicola]|uniref:Protein kinase domain-containing protein n=1 Tax=Clonostachys byssicola TaxID=160290 RepID=A0A9N9Y6F5_9HYPO|nr:unnamed protein product [Clonostachys byssicola]
MSSYQNAESLSLMAGPERTPLKVKIRKLITPSTLSCGMVVDILDAPGNLSLPTTAFLKLYDRRFATQRRQDQKVDDPWTPDIDLELLEYSRNGEAGKFLVDYDDDPENNEFDDDWPRARKETYLADLMKEQFETETKVYDALIKHQGNYIPKLFTTVILDFSTEKDASRPPHLFYAYGILIEFIDGFMASEINQFVEQKDWEFLVNEASKVVGAVFNNVPIVNEDIRPANMMICQTDGEPRYRLVLIDFGQCEFRDGETDAEWGRIKHTQDEEGAMGYVLVLQLRNKTGVEVNTWIDFAETEEETLHLMSKDIEKTADS